MIVWIIRIKDKLHIHEKQRFKAVNLHSGQDDEINKNYAINHLSKKEM